MDQILTRPTLRDAVGERKELARGDPTSGEIQNGALDLGGGSAWVPRTGADLVLFGSTLTAADTAQLSATAVRHSYDTIVAALVAAVADDVLGPTPEKMRHSAAYDWRRIHSATPQRNALTCRDGCASLSGEGSL